MINQIWTHYAGDKYPMDYPMRLARTLEPYGINLWCLVTEHESLPLTGNLNLFDVNPVMTDGLKFDLDGWWWKLLFFNPAFGQDQILYVDLDTVFLKNPLPILEWLDEKDPAAAFIRDPVRANVAGTSLFYVNHRAEIPGKVWDSFLSLSESPGPSVDFYITAVLKRHQWLYFPAYFQAQYKAMYPPKSMWMKAREMYDTLSVDDMISMHFNGKPDPHNVLATDMPGHKVIRKTRWMLDNE